MKFSSKSLLVIFGPTGVGKSELAERLATYIPADIVNMDMGQLYTPLSIGTAKPAWRQSSIPHHLFDILNRPEHFSVIDYRKRLLATVQSIWDQQRLPIVVGGSCFYAQSLFFPPTTPARHNTVHSYVDANYAWQKLYEIDPQRAINLNKGDLFRITRALDIWEGTGKKPSEFMASFQPIGHTLFIGVTRDRPTLYARINERVYSMMQEGFLDEVAHLPESWRAFLHEKKIIGYNELLDFLSTDPFERNLTTTINAIAQRTRHYAKRQYTFWRSLKKKLCEHADQVINGQPAMQVQECNLTAFNLDLYINHLLKKIVDNR